MKIGVFDSGSGGEFAAERLKKLLSQHHFLVTNDRSNLPYGDKSEAQVRYLTDQAIQKLLPNCPIIVLACNTATVSAINFLRQKYPQTYFIGLEPMIKPAAEITKTKHVSLLATKVTNHSQRTQELIDKFATNIIVDKPDTTNWVKLIEAHQIDDINLDSVKKSIKNGSDTLILGCTHYLALESKLKQLFPKVKVLEPSQAIAQRINNISLMI